MKRFLLALILILPFLLIFMPSIAFGQVNNTVLESFEDQSYSDDANCFSAGADGVYWGQQECADASVLISSDKAREGTYSSKHYIWSDCILEEKQRAEISGAQCTDYEPRLSSDIWEAFSISPGDDLQAGHDVDIVHQYGVGYDSCTKTSLSPVLSLSIESGLWMITSRACNATSTAVDNQFLTFSSGSDAIADKGKWVDVVIHVYFRDRTQADGVLEVWKNGVKVVDYTGKTSYDRPSGEVGYRKFGIYNTVPLGPTPMTIYIDSYRRRPVWLDGSYAAVCPTILPKAPSIVYPLNTAPSIPVAFTLDYDTYLEGYSDLARSYLTDTNWDGAHPDGAFRHYDSEFRISTSNSVDSDGMLVTAAWTGSTTTGDLTKCSVTGLNSSQLYYVQARYRNTADVDRNFDGLVNNSDRYWGPWSAVTSFATSGYQTADVNASTNVQAFLNYLAYIRDKAGTVQKIVLGQGIDQSDTASSWDDSEGGRYHEYVTELHDDYTNPPGKWMSFIGNQGIYGSATHPNSKARIHTYWDAGSAPVYMHWRPNNAFDPDCANLYEDGVHTNYTQCNPSPSGCADWWCGGCNTDGYTNLANLYADECAYASCTKWKAERSRMADYIEDLAGYGVVVMFRPLAEFNGRWFWVSDNTDDITAQMWRDLYINIFEYMTITRGLHNIIWLWGPVLYWGQAYGTADPESWWKWYPGDDYVDLIAPSNYYNSLISNPNVALYWRAIQKYTDSWSNTGGDYPNVWEVDTGKIGSVYVGGTCSLSSCSGGTNYSSVASLSLVESTSNSYYWAWDRSHGGRLYVHGNPGALAVWVKYYTGGESIITEMLNMGSSTHGVAQRKLVVLGETGRDSVNEGPINWTTEFLPKIKDKYSSVPLAMIWGGAWAAVYHTNPNAMMNDPYVIDRDDLKPVAPTLSSPANASTNISLLPTLQTDSIFYGPRSHWKTKWQICNDSACVNTPVWDSGWVGVSTPTEKHTITVGTALNSNSKYYWRAAFAMNVNNSETSSNWSSIYEFTTTGARHGISVLKGTFR